MERSITLAITTIQDLLLRHRLSECDDDQLGRVDLDVPEYQRPYKWTEKNTIQLLDDIVDSKDANRERYRVGTLILNRRDKAGERMFDIVDGQQRLTTIYLTLKARRRRRPLEVQPDMAELLRDGRLHSTGGSGRCG